MPFFLLVLVGFVLAILLVYALAGIGSDEKAPFAAFFLCLILAIDITWLSVGANNVQVEKVDIVDIGIAEASGTKTQFAVVNGDLVNITRRLNTFASEGSKLKVTHYKHWSCGIWYDYSPVYEIVPPTKELEKK